MILDVEPPPKSPTSSGPTVRQRPGPSVPRSYATFPQTHQRAQHGSNATGSETRPLLYQPTQALYDDAEPPAYDEINTPAKTSATRKRLWTRLAAVFLVIFLTVLAFYSYEFTKIPRSHPTPNVPERPTPPGTPTKGPSRPSPSPPHSLPPLPPVSPSPEPSTTPFIPPIKGRTDLCRPWAYSAQPGVRPTSSDNQPIDKLVYTVPTLAPIHLETSAICLTSKGSSEFCENYDDTYDSISGKLQVVGADVELPRIDVTIQHGSQGGLDDTAVCLMKNSDENGKDRWVLGLYAWKDPNTNDRNGVLASMSIIVTLPSSQIHNLSTRLNYFVQVIGPEVKRDSNALTFDTLEAHLGERGSLSVRNVTAATIKTQAYGDAQWILDTNVTNSVQIQSDSGLIACLVRLVQTEGSPPVRLDVQSEIGSVSARAILEYPSTPRTPPRFDINMFSRFSPAMLLLHDPRGTSLLRQNPHLVPDTLPIIRVNATSHLSIAQAAIPATYQGGLSLSSKHAAIVAIDHAKDLHGRTVSWDKPTSRGYRGTVQWAGRSQSKETGFVSVTTEYAAARLLFLGLDDDDISNWPEGGDTITPSGLPLLTHEFA